MNITAIYASGRNGRSCSRGTAQLLIGELVKDERSDVFEFQLTDDMPHMCRGCGACINGHEEKCGGWAYMQPIIVVTTAGGGMKSAVKDIRDSAGYWGIARTHVIAKSVWNYNWKNIPNNFMASIEVSVKKTADKIKRSRESLTPSWKVKCRFYLYRALHRRGKMTEADDKYWKKMGYNAGRPWKSRGI